MSSGFRQYHGDVKALGPGVAPSHHSAAPVSGFSVLSPVPTPFGAAHSESLSEAIAAAQGEVDAARAQVEKYSGFFASKSKKAAAEAELQRAESALLLLVPGSILGTHLRTLVIKNSHSNTGLAISSDGSVMAVTNVSTHKVLVYSLLHGALRGEFGGKGSGMGQFNNPEKICFASRSSTNVFIADSDNKRVQEMSTSGAHVRTIGEGVIDGKVVGVAASADVIAVGVQRQPKRVILFSIASGAPIRSFGDKGMAEGELSGIRSLRFSPDGGHLIVTESKNNRLSLFTLSGVFVRCIGVGTLFGPLDTDFSPTGDILVADFGNDRVCVFCADGALLRTFGKSGTIPGKFQCPMALGVHGGHLYVLDNESARVQVFS